MVATILPPHRANEAWYISLQEDYGFVILGSPQSGMLIRKNSNFTHYAAVQQHITSHLGDGTETVDADEYTTTWYGGITPQQRRTLQRTENLEEALQLQL